MCCGIRGCQDKEGDAVEESLLGVKEEGGHWEEAVRCRACMHIDRAYMHKIASPRLTECCLD